MKTYELTYIIPDKIEEKEIPKISERIKKLLPDGKIIKEEFWGRRKLAYPILKNDFGYYTTLIFETEPENIENMAIKLRLDEDVIRHLIVSVKKPVKIEEKPKPKPKEAELPKIKVKAKPPASSLRSLGEGGLPRASRKAKITEEIEKEEKKMKALDEKLEEILKE
jgi:small subunit ribosomal protein S6